MLVREKCVSEEGEPFFELVEKKLLYCGKLVLRLIGSMVYIMRSTMNSRISYLDNVGEISEQAG